MTWYQLYHIYEKDFTGNAVTSVPVNLDWELWVNVSLDPLTGKTKPNMYSLCGMYYECVYNMWKHPVYYNATYVFVRKYQKIDIWNTIVLKTAVDTYSSFLFQFQICNLDLIPIRLMIGNCFHYKTKLNKAVFWSSISYVPMGTHYSAHRRIASAEYCVEKAI